MTPPPFAEALVRHAVAADAAGLSVVGDLRQEFIERATRHGAVRARCWYWRQAMSVWWWSAWRHPAESHHSPRGGALFDVIGDLRHARRAALKTPGQTLLMIATLGVGIGFTTIGFSFADTVFLRGMPIADPEHTVILYSVDAREPEERSPHFAADYLDFRERVRSVEDLSAFAFRRETLTRRGVDAVRVTVGKVAGDLFGVWGLRAQLGRGLRAGDDRPGAAPVAVLSDRFWRETFNKSPQVIRETLTLDGIAHEVVGVMPPDVEFANFANVAMWAPLPLPVSHARDLTPVSLTGRLAKGATVASADAEFRVLTQTIAETHPDTNRGRQTLVLAATRALGGPNVLLVMTLLVGTATLVTVIAGVNVAGVLLARAVVRQQEFAMRVALGARRARVFRQLLAEGLLVAVLGAAAGLLVAGAGLRLIHSVDAEPILRQIVIDWHEVAFVAALGLVSPLVFSLAPALAAIRVNLTSALNASGTRTIGSSRRGREWLVTTQLALAIGLAVISGLVVRTVGAIVTSPNGFESSDVLTFVMALDQQRDSAAARRALLRDISDKLETLGNLTVGALDLLPAVTSEAVSTIQQDAPSPDQSDPWAHVNAIDEGTLTALRVPLAEGRLFTAQDIEGDGDVAMVSLETARRYFGGVQNALGRRLTLQREGKSRVYQVVGVTGDVRSTDPERGMPPRVWVPMSDPGNVTFVVRASGDLRMAGETVRRVARELVPGVPVESLESYDQAIARRNGGNRVAMGMLISFAVVALLFATTGLYGTVALSANMRRAEFATRFALGARVADIASLVVGQAVKLLAVGGAFGLTVGVLAASAMRRVFYGVSPLDPLNLLAVLTLLAVVTLAASIAPALRAARIDVVQAMRMQ